MRTATALPIKGAACLNRVMLTGVELGRAFAEAMREKCVKQADIVREFGVKQPSVSEWIKYGRIGKQHIPKLLTYFADVVGPDHWGLPFSRDEFDLVLAFRELHPASQATLLQNVRQAAAQEAQVRRRSAGLLGGDLGNEKAA